VRGGYFESLGDIAYASGFLPNIHHHTCAAKTTPFPPRETRATTDEARIHPNIKELPAPMMASTNGSLSAPPPSESLDSPMPSSAKRKRDDNLDDSPNGMAKSNGSTTESQAQVRDLIDVLKVYVLHTLPRRLQIWLKITQNQAA
jgi:hypothetical protein